MGFSCDVYMYIHINYKRRQEVRGRIEQMVTGIIKKIYSVAAYFSLPATSHHQMQMPRGEYVCIYQYAFLHSFSLLRSLRVLRMTWIVVSFVNFLFFLMLSMTIRFFSPFETVISCYTAMVFKVNYCFYTFTFQLVKNFLIILFF